MRTPSFSCYFRGVFPAILAITLSMVMALLAAPLAEGQISGTLTGTVLDQAGAVVPKADITLVNQATNDTRRSTSNDAGYFSFVGLNPGTYILKVTKESFKTWQRGEISLS